MDQHPIPQNVTGFQFKLIGSMTVKQFGYVAAGVITAFVIYYLPIHGIFATFLKIFLIPFFGASGPILAFLPIDGRPVDVMAGNFMRALFSPNQYVYHKSPKRFSFSTVSLSTPHLQPNASQVASSTPKQKMINERGRELQKLLISSNEHKIRNAQDLRENAFLEAIKSAPQPAQPPQPTASSPTTPAAMPKAQQAAPTKEERIVPPAVPAPSHAPTPGPTPEILSKKEEILKKQLEFSKQEEKTANLPTDISAIHQKTIALEKQVQEIHAQKQLLEQEIISLKQQLSQQKTPVINVTQSTAAATPTPTNKPMPHVRTVTKEMNKRLGIFVSDTPNVVSGMVKDARGNVLPNILVEIKDKGGNPVRAFKTNSLGNFASATPLSPGDYTITLEDLKKQHTFDEIKITANDQIMLPIEIISYDKREELRKDLFS